MISMPRGLTSATGIDALTHTIEGSITKGALEISDIMVWKAIEMIVKHLPVVVKILRMWKHETK